MATNTRKTDMKKRIIIIIFLFFTVVNAQNNQEIFLQANKLYEQNDYPKAFLLYESIPQKGSAVWFNMGCCLAMQEKYIDALLFYKRALKNAYGSNYSLIQKRINIIKHEKFGLSDNSPMLSNFLSLIMHQFSLFFWQCLFLLLWFLMSLAGPNLFQRNNYIILSLLILSILSTALFIGKKYSFMNRTTGLVIQDASIFVGPDDRLATNGALNKGQEVIITTQKDGWYKIALTDRKGWVPEANITQV